MASPTHADSCFDRCEVVSRAEEKRGFEGGVSMGRSKSRNEVAFDGLDLARLNSA